MSRNKLESYELHKNRTNNVVKSNVLIQKSRHNLTLNQQKILLYVISKIEMSDKEFETYSLDIREICQVIGLEEVGANYERFKDNIKALRDSSFWFETERELNLVSWLEDVRIDKFDLVVRFKLNELLKPYLLELKNNFTKYSLLNILAMRSRHSINLYEILKSYYYKGYKEYSIEEFKKILCIEKSAYKVYADLRRYVLDVAVREINKYTDLKVVYSCIKQGRKITGIYFDIKPKEEMNDKINAVIAIESALKKEN